MWELLRGLGGNYGEYPSQTGTRRREDIGDLDPVHCAGQVNMQKVHSYATRINFVVALMLIGVITDEKLFLAQMSVEQFGPGVQQAPRRIFYTNKKYAKHFDMLVGYNLLQVTSPEFLRQISTYFSVPKDEIFDRAIFNGKRFSKRFRASPPVNLLDPPRALRKMCEWAKRGKGFGVVVGDIRHWFHQIPLVVNVARWFGLAIGQRGRDAVFYFWTCLPMGWSFSPAIAQSFGWMMLTYHEPDEFDHVRMSNPTDPNLPLWIPIYNREGVEVGYATIYYDNYLLLCVCPKTLEILNHRIKRNAEVFNIALKEHDCFTRHDLILKEEPNRDPQDAPDAPKRKRLSYLGVEIGFEFLRGVFLLKWRMSPKMFDAPFFEANKPLAEVTSQDIARVIGKTLYGRCLSLLPLGRESTTLEILKILGNVSRFAFYQGWRKGGCPVTAADVEILEREWRWLQSNPWRYSTLQNYSPSEIAVVATDASTEYGMGAVTMVDGVVTNHMKSPFNKELRVLHIYLLEMHAAVEGVLWTVAINPTIRKVFLIVDNTAAAGSFRRGCSTNAVAMKMMARLSHLTHIDIEVISVPTQVNVADSPSRNVAITPERTHMTWKAYLGHLEGRKLFTAPEYVPSAENSGRLRHEEGNPFESDEVFEIFSQEEENE